MRLTTPTTPTASRPHPHPPGQLPPTPGALDASDTPAQRRAGPALRRHLLVGAVVVAGLSTAVLLATATFAYADPTGGHPHNVVALADSVTAVLNNVRNWIMGILAGLATVFLTIGGVRYVIAAGDPGEVEKAKTAFKSASWGYGLAALAPMVVEILKGIVGA
jgi:hypothetical protein